MRERLNTCATRRMLIYDLDWGTLTQNFDRGETS